jgi:cell division protease FtsH
VLVSWAPFLLLIGFWLYFMSQFKSGGGANLDSARKAVASRLDRAEPRVAPASLSGGAAAALAELRDLVTARPPAAVLLTSASGSGKGHVLRTLAAEVPSPSLVADGASFAEIFLGVAAARVRTTCCAGPPDARLRPWTSTPRLPRAAVFVAWCRRKSSNPEPRARTRTRRYRR